MKCDCRIEKCCCTELKNESILHVIKTLESKIVNVVEDQDFFKKFDQGRNEYLYFCTLCHRYGSPSSGKHFEMGGDWIFKGVSFSKVPRKKNYYFKRHLKSKQHLQSIEREKHDDKTKFFGGKPSFAERKQSTENLCRASQYVIDYNLSFSHLGVLAGLMKLVNPPKILPLGNQNHSRKNFGDLLQSNYEAIISSIKEELNAINTNTKQKIRLMLSFDKGTANNDAGRQAIVASHVGTDGHLSERVLSVARIFDCNAIGHVEHVKNNVSSFIDLKLISVICTDGAATYTGGTAGMHEIMISQPSFHPKLILLNDLCHRTELLLKLVMPDWLKESFDLTKSFGKIFDKGDKMNQYINEFCSLESSYDHIKLASMSDTRYIEYTHVHISSFLNNIQLYHNFFSSILNKNHLVDYHDKARFGFEIIKNPLLICRLLLANDVFVQASLMEKVGQSTNFGAFDFVKVVSSFKNYLISINDVPNVCKYLFENNTLRLNFTYNKKSYKVDMIFDISNVDLIQMRHDYFSWIKNILFYFDEYFEPHSVMTMIINLFSFNSRSVDEKHEIAISLFKNSNLDFLRCGFKCLGFEQCICLKNELNRYLDHVNSIKDTFKKNGEFDYKELLAFYLSKPEVAKLNITNVIRIIELAQLLKPNQSTTERVFSIVDKTVDGHFEGKYIDSSCNLDLVDPVVVSKLNSNFVMLDAKSARLNFIKKNHREAYMKSYDKTSHSKVVNKLTTKLLSKSKVNCKRKRLTFETKSKKPRYSDAPKESSSKTKIGDNLSINSQPIADTESVDDPQPIADPESIDEPEPIGNDLPKLISANQPCSSGSSIEISDTRIYCICKEKPGVSPDSDFIGCSRNRFCISRKERLNDMNVLGGDWFHKRCIGMKQVPSKNWFCNKCKLNKNTNKKVTLRSLLITELLKMNKKIKVLKGISNENSLIGCFSHSLFDNHMMYDKVLNDLKSTLNMIVSNLSNKSMHEENNPLSFLVSKIINSYTAIDFNDEHSRNNFCATVNVKTHSHLFIHLFAYKEQTDVWIIKGDNIFKKFTLDCISTYEKFKPSTKFIIFLKKC